MRQNELPCCYFDEKYQNFLIAIANCLMKNKSIQYLKENLIQKGFTPSIIYTQVGCIEIEMCTRASA